MQVTELVIDPNSPQFAYVASPSGFYRSTDGGVSWQLSNQGLRIPLVYHVFAPREFAGTIFASTPAGLVTSTDHGQTWNRPILILNGRGLNRSDRGGYGYLVAYWTGRYLGCVSDQQATAPPTTTERVR